MKLTLHHINLSTEKVGEMTDFYRRVLRLSDTDRDIPALEKGRGYSGEVGFVWDGAVQVHLAEKDVMAGFKTGQIVNPLVRGHIAYRTDDLDAFRAHLEAQGVPYSDWGHAAVKGWRQIFFYDPDGNIIEVHEVSATPDGAAGDP
ncbi:VOC family protein [Salipiger thiooxidans]|uniref:VOC family protein n=1 Tax=Salipiger thiooxidans TaxID=282683 RepID=UPI001A907018|nr:VOC family protein [Salipiger thiooxidans]MBN8185132.1 VOC family protein [Salipiger thiooxidans]